jgi:acetyl esterase/lipase
MKILQIPAKNSNHNSPATYKPGDALPPRHIRVDGRETLRRHAEAFEQHLRDEAARMARTGRRAA